MNPGPPALPSGPPLAATPRRVATGAAVLSAGIVVSATQPAPLSDLGVALFSVLAFLGAAVLARVAARDSSHPGVWGWYAGALVVAGAGAALALHTPGSSVPMTVGALPGMLLTVPPLLRLIPRGSWGRLRGQLVTSLLLFLDAGLLCGLATFELVSGRTLGLGSLFDATVVALGATLALLTAMGLLVVASTSGPLRRVAVLAFAGQLAVAAALVLMAFSDEEHAATAPLVATAVVTVVGLALLVSAALLDQDVTEPVVSDEPLSFLAAVLPHLTVLAGGSLLLSGVLVTGTLSTAQTVLGGVGLVLLAIHQAVAWHDGRHLTRSLQHSEAYFRAVVRSAVDPVVILDGDLTITWASPGLGDIVGRAGERLVGRDVRTAVHPDDRPALTAALLAPQVGDSREGRTTTARVRHDDGRWLLLQARVRDLRDDPDVGAIVLHCRDLTREAAPRPAVADAQPLGGSDPETGLPDRSALVARLAELARGGAEVGLVKIGIGGLPDTPQADVVRELAGRLSRVLRGGDRLLRSGPREFAVLVDGTISDAETLAERLVAAVPADAPVLGLRLTAHAGLTSLEGSDREPVAVLRRASLALDSARVAGPGRVRRHSVALLIAQNRREALRTDLAGALDRGELRLVYQPVTDLALQRVTSVEALLRWQHPTWGAVSPAEFVPLAEESALVTELGRWVMRTAAAAIADLDDDLCVAVNVAARHVRSGELLADVTDALAASGLAPERLVLELTESVLLDEAHVTDELAALRRMGVRIAVDDFGTGWSSLAYLVGLPVDVLKMDRAFLASLETDPRHQALCRSVLHLGTSLGLDVVVEGVETPRELQLLRDMGHRFVQGFLLARPTELPDLAGTVHAVPTALQGADR
ncbi:EAL domain-containing protein [Klenkia sp. PcliD-1-E]|uniref:putative bifunctional diguanylate cyclase/phosphodiesterase n=1 Tax=Klenkia sp. PcliD-1-E TaxID=2954492 RepID=UPI0020982001|nr:EAL domain-containing protein [Klenkia sp. PcliD-1-E]MCO7222410.1 EAL domain-containing protein [Klenkia sp. PcliD-1-E]